MLKKIDLVGILIVTMNSRKKRMVLTKKDEQAGSSFFI